MHPNPIAPILAELLRSLPRRQRPAVTTLLAVFRTLRDIARAPGLVLRPASTLYPDCNSPATATSACSSGVCSSPSDCSDTPQARTHVGHSVLDHLRRNQPTGQPELDAFATLLNSLNLSLEPFHSYLQAELQRASLPRLATWARWRDLSTRTEGAAIALLWQALITPPKAQALRAWDSPTPHIPDPAKPRPSGPGTPPILPPTALAQVHALAAAAALLDQLLSVRDDWSRRRITLPLDDLAQAGVCEHDFTRWHAQGQAASDPAWRALAQSQAQRIHALLRGGLRALTTLPSPRARRALAASAWSLWQLAQQTAQAQLDPWQPTPELPAQAQALRAVGFPHHSPSSPSLLQKLRQLRIVASLAQDPEQWDPLTRRYTSPTARQPTPTLATTQHASPPD